MKKSLAAMAALVVCGAASAQSNVTLFGVVDAAVRNVSNKSESISLFSPIGGVKASRTELANSGLSSSRLGFRGVEDLGGGLAAGFWLEAPIRNDDGTEGIATFSRRATVSLSGGFGELRLGRDYTAHALNDSQFDPFGDTGIGGSLIVDANEASNANNVGNTGGFGSNTTYKRAGNMVQYFLPKDLGGFYGHVGYAFHEQTRQSPHLDIENRPSTGRYVGGRIGYTNGPLDVALAYGQSDTAYGGRTGKIKTFNAGATYDFGVVKLFGEYSQSSDERDALWSSFAVTPDVDLKGYLLGVTVPVGAGVIRASYAQVKYDYNLNNVWLWNQPGDPKANKLALGYVHNLSKRTALFGTIARVSNKNGAGLTVGAGPSFVTAVNDFAFRPKTSTGYEFGIRHSF